jgi:hypothetical protein
MHDQGTISGKEEFGSEFRKVPWRYGLQGHEIIGVILRSW